MPRYPDLRHLFPSAQMSKTTKGKGCRPKKWSFQRRLFNSSKPFRYKRIIYSVLESIASEKWNFLVISVMHCCLINPFGSLQSVDQLNVIAEYAAMKQPLVNMSTIMIWTFFLMIIIKVWAKLEEQNVGKRTFQCISKGGWLTSGFRNPKIPLRISHMILQCFDRHPYRDTRKIAPAAKAKIANLCKAFSKMLEI